MSSRPSVFEDLLVVDLDLLEFVALPLTPFSSVLEERRWEVECSVWPSSPSPSLEFRGFEPSLPLSNNDA